MRYGLIAFLVVVAISLGPASALGKKSSRGFRTDRAVRVVVIGGSISMYYKGNYGEFLQHGCKNIEVVNHAKVGAGGRALVKRFREVVLDDKKLMKQLAAKEAWVLFQGGLNSVFSPESTNWHLAQLFKLATDSGMQTMALSLTPWGSDKDSRFQGFEGVRFVRATKRINRFLAGKLSPDRALGRRAAKHPHEWMKGEVPQRFVDVFNTDIRDQAAALRPAAPLEKAFARSRYRKKNGNKAALVQEARAVPRNFMKASYSDFDHIHPKSKGHRVMAVAACKKAPASWGCDCAKIGRAKWKKGKVVGS